MGSAWESLSIPWHAGNGARHTPNPCGTAPQPVPRGWRRGGCVDSGKLGPQRVVVRSGGDFNFVALLAVDLNHEQHRVCLE